MIGNISAATAILIIYPDGDGHQMLEATNPKRFESKSQLLEQGIMAGAFFEESNFSSTFDPKLKPLRSPYPTFILRNTRRFDWVFVGGVPQLRDIYLKQFGSPPNHSEKFIVPILGVKTWSTDFYEVVNFGRTSGNTRTEAVENSGINHLRNDLRQKLKFSGNKSF